MHAAGLDLLRAGSNGKWHKMRAERALSPFQLHFQVLAGCAAIAPRASAAPPHRVCPCPRFNEEVQAFVCVWWRGLSACASARAHCCEDGASTPGPVALGVVAGSAFLHLAQADLCLRKSLHSPRGVCSGPSRPVSSGESPFP